MRPILEKVALALCFDCFLHLRDLARRVFSSMNTSATEAIWLVETKIDVLPKSNTL